jgi:hypothetical protein
MFLMSDDQIDRTVAHFGRNFFCGIALVVLAIKLPADWRSGIFSGVQLFSLGIYAACLRNWRTERGIWMLALLLTVTLSPLWILLEYQHFESVFLRPFANQPPQRVDPPRGTLSEQIRFTIDATIALMIYAKVIRLVSSVAVRNRQLTKGRICDNYDD